MEEEIDLIMETTEDAMKGALKHLEKQMLKIRAGNSSPS